ncbi:hypothetical protein V5O48_015692 [Marasmius crinis-equi]|uniref:Uncharacterized protein n=1 Tax=Marasmius crinis-equi TaxID=585013 RepID=A0ABR3EU46_9AGAR
MVITTGAQIWKDDMRNITAVVIDNKMHLDKETNEEENKDEDDEKSSRETHEGGNNTSKDDWVVSNTGRANEDHDSNNDKPDDGDNPEARLSLSDLQRLALLDQEVEISTNNACQQGSKRGAHKSAIKE